jgi:transcriptional regulator GlxA family with amidase domain
VTGKCQQFAILQNTYVSESLFLASSKTMRVLLGLLCLTFFTSAFAAEGGKKNPPAPRTVGVLLFSGFELLDAAGPMELWGSMGKNVTLVTVAKQKGEIPSSQGVKVTADFGFADCPKLDFIVVPGGMDAFTALKDENLLDFIRQRSKEAEITMSVCNGASILAAAGQLDDRSATTNKAFWDQCIAFGPKVKWVRKARWVDDGNIVTSSGVSAGMDMTLHVISRFYGEKRAERLAAMIEYEWHRDPSWDPFADLHAK